MSSSSSLSASSTSSSSQLLNTPNGVNTSTTASSTSHEPLPLPPNWTTCPKVSSTLIPHTPFFLCKTPIDIHDTQYNTKHLDSRNTFTLQSLIDYMKNKSFPPIGLIIDLTPTSTTTQSSPFYALPSSTSNITYVHLPVNLDLNDTTLKASDIDATLIHISTAVSHVINSFLRKHQATESFTSLPYTIVIHDIYSYNIAPYMIVSYVCHELDWSLSLALQCISRVRSPGIYHKYVLRSLLGRFGSSDDMMRISKGGHGSSSSNKISLHIQPPAWDTVAMKQYKSTNTRHDEKSNVKKQTSSSSTSTASSSSFTKPSTGVKRGLSSKFASPNSSTTATTSTATTTKLPSPSPSISASPANTEQHDERHQSSTSENGVNGVETSKKRMKLNTNFPTRSPTATAGSTSSSTSSTPPTVASVEANPLLTQQHPYLQLLSDDESQNVIQSLNTSISHMNPDDNNNTTNSNSSKDVTDVFQLLQSKPLEKLTLQSLASTEKHQSYQSSWLPAGNVYFMLYINNSGDQCYILSNHHVYLISNLTFPSADDTTRLLNNTLVCGELVIDTDTKSYVKSYRLLITDLWMVESRWVCKEMSLNERLKLAQKYIIDTRTASQSSTSSSSCPLRFRLKMTFPFNKTYKPISMLPTLPHPARGITLLYAPPIQSFTSSSSYQRYVWYLDDDTNDLSKDELIAITKGVH